MRARMADPAQRTLQELRKRGKRKSDSLKGSGRRNNYRAKSSVSRRCLAAQYFLRRQLTFYSRNYGANSISCDRGCFAKSVAHAVVSPTRYLRASAPCAISG